MRALPSVSVCIPVYRGEQFLAETIRSVLDQTYRDFELVILDNASPDDSGRIARSFDDRRVRVETNPTTVPQPENWRRVVRLCRAPLIKLLCADDLLHPRCLELQVAPMDADPGLAVVAARRHMIDEQSRVIVPRIRTSSPSRSLCRPPGSDTSTGGGSGWRPMRRSRASSRIGVKPLARGKPTASMTSPALARWRSRLNTWTVPVSSRT